MLDAEFFIRAVSHAAYEATGRGLDRIVEIAKSKAPVRKMFMGGRRRTSPFAFGPLEGAQLNQSRGQAYEYRNRTARKAFDLPSGRTVVLSSRRFNYRPPGFSGAKYYRPSSEMLGGTGRGRPNSLQPVVSLPGIGRVMGDFRTLSAPGKLAAGEIFARVNGKTVRGDLNSKLTSRARYDLAHGRGVITGESGEEQYGGKLRDSIERIGPVIEDGEVVGYVKASAMNQDGTYNYAVGQELGNGRTRPQPYLRPALREFKREILTLERNAFQRGFGAAARAVKPRGGHHLKRSFKLEVEFTGGLDKLGDL